MKHDQKTLLSNNDVRQSINDWVVVNNLETDIPTEIGVFYLVLCKGGKIRAAVLEKHNYEHKYHSSPMYWDAMTGAQGTIYADEVLAYKRIDIPEDIIKMVLSNGKSRNSVFARYYK